LLLTKYENKIFKHIFILLATYVLMEGNTCSGLFRWDLVPTSTKTMERKSEKKWRMNYLDEKVKVDDELFG
jgi:hypothetical protein